MRPDPPPPFPAAPPGSATRRRQGTAAAGRPPCVRPARPRPQEGPGVPPKGLPDPREEPDRE